MLTPELEEILFRSRNQPHVAYQEYLKAAPDVARLESSHEVVSNRYRRGTCDLCLAPIVSFGPEIRTSAAGKWVHAPYRFTTAASHAFGNSANATSGEQLALALDAEHRSVHDACGREVVARLILDVSGVDVHQLLDLSALSECAGVLHRHHRVPRQDGGRGTPENLITLCFRHHSLVHKVMAIFGRAGAAANDREVGR